VDIRCSFSSDRCRTRSYGGSRSSRTRPLSSPRAQGSAPRYPLAGGLQLSQHRRARVPRHRSRACLGDRDGPSAAAAGPRWRRNSTDRTLSRWRGTDPAWVGTGVGTGWEQIVSPRDSSCPLMSPRNSLVCRGFPIRAGNGGPLGPPPTEPKVTGSNPVGRAREGLYRAKFAGIATGRRRRVGTGGNKTARCRASATRSRPTNRRRLYGPPVFEPGALSLSAGYTGVMLDLGGWLVWSRASPSTEGLRDCVGTGPITRDLAASVAALPQQQSQAVRRRRLSLLVQGGRGGLDHRRARSRFERGCGGVSV
jgi:hypothetical protein